MFLSILQVRLETHPQFISGANATAHDLVGIMIRGYLAYPAQCHVNLH